MANIKSAKKRILVSEKQNLRNRMINSALKTAIKRVRTAVEAGDNAAIDVAYRTAVSKIDKAAAKGIIHKNAAARKKMQLAVMVAR